MKLGFRQRLSDQTVGVVMCLHFDFGLQMCGSILIKVLCFVALWISTKKRQLGQEV